MLRPTLLLLTIAALACQAAPNTDEAIDHIYNNVVVGDYDSALVNTKELENNNKGNVITEVVNKLLDNSQRNIMEYAHKLWNRDARDIVKNRFPIQFRMILGTNTVKLINKRDNLALKLGVAVDNDGDRTAYGDSNDKTSETVSWKFVPVSDDKRVYFKIMNVQRSQFLKLGVTADSDGEHKAYGSSSADSFRHQWYLHPVKYNGEFLFYIFNREYNHALKLGRAVDSMGDRQLWGNNGNVIGNPDLFGWHIAPF